MRFAIDIDGVLSNFTASVVIAANSLWPGKLSDNFIPDNWNYEGSLTSEEFKQVWAVIKQTPHLWVRQAPLGGLAQLQQGIQKDDEIFFITARAHTTGASPSVQSSLWLYNHGLWPRFGYSQVIAVEDAKYKQDLFRALKLRFMLDDYAPTIEQLNQIDEMYAFVLDQPWNKHAKHLPRVYSVADYLDTIRQMANDESNT